MASALLLFYQKQPPRNYDAVAIGPKLSDGYRLAGAGAVFTLK